MKVKVAAFALMMMVGSSVGAMAGDAAKGEDIFNKKCKSCHTLTDAKKAGPGLAGVTDRRTDEWLDHWLADTKNIIAAGKDPVVVALMQGSKVKMPTVKEMTDDTNRADMIAFLKKNDGK
jgi:cytochrome c2